MQNSFDGDGEVYKQENILLQKLNSIKGDSPETSTGEQFTKVLRSALRSPYSSVRKAALRLTSTCENAYTNSASLSQNLVLTPAIKSVLRIALEVEQCPADFHCYRQRAQILRRLKFTSLAQMLSNYDDDDNGQQQLLQKIILDWLLSQFYEQFTLYWPLLVEPIESYAQGMQADDFWDCFEQALDLSWAKAVQLNGHRENGQEEKIEAKTDGNEMAEKNDLRSIPPPLKPDFGAYRIQLLRLLTKLPIRYTKAEQRTRYLAPKFLQLYREEFMHFDEIDDLSKDTTMTMDQNGMKAEGSDYQHLHMENEDEQIDKEDKEVVIVEEEDDENIIEENVKETPNHKHPKPSMSHRPLNFHTLNRGTLNTLKAMLNIFGRFANPKSVYREPEVREIYYELLLTNEPEVQKLALGCLLTYKDSWLIPYRESLEGILDEKRFRDQLVLFSVDYQQTAAMESENLGRTGGKNISRAIPLLEEHRAQLMPILLRLLYGSLHTHVAQRGVAKRMAIFRFLANCLEHELVLFLRLLFGPLISLFEYTATDGEVDLEKTLNSFTNQKRQMVQCISLNKLKSLLGTLGDVFRLLGPVLDDVQLHLLFNALLLTGRTILLRDKWFNEQKCTTALESNNLNEEEGSAPEAVDSSPLARQLKNLRLLCVQIIIKFLYAFQSRPSLPITGLQYLLSHFIGPLITAKGSRMIGMDKLEHIALPASVCSLFCVWAKIPRYHPILNVPLAIEYSSLPSSIIIQTTPFSLLCDQLLLHFVSSSTAVGTCKPSSIHLEILRVCCRLLDSTTEQMEFDTGPLQNLVELFPQAELNSTKSSFPARLVLATAHVDKILAHLSLVIRGPQNNDGQTKSIVQIGRIPPVYFDVLNRLSADINRPELGSLFAQTLLQYITNKRGQALRRQRSEKAQNLLVTLKHISNHLEDPLGAISLVGPLFSHLDGRPLREALTHLVISLAQNERFPENLQKFMDLFEGIESWDTRRIAEPDADRRCETLLRLHDLYEQKEKSPLLANTGDTKGTIAFLIPLFAHSHVHSIMHSTDLSVRGLAANCFRQLISFIAHPIISKYLDSSRLLHSHLIPLTLRGLKVDENNGGESVRNEFIQCLVHLLRSFPNEPHLAPLKAICGENGIIGGEEDEVDHPDMDFFECVMHIQPYRRQQAFYRLAERLNSGELDETTIGHFPLINYILPIVEPYLMDNTPNRAALTDKALGLLTAILKRTPWSKFQKILEHYLRQVDNEERTKPAIRVVFAILDAFHFDLRQCQEIELTASITALKIKSAEDDKKKKQGEGEGDENIMEEEENKELDEAMEEEEGDEKPEDAEECPEEVENPTPGNIQPKQTMEGRQKIYAIITRKLIPRLRNLLNPQRQMNSHRRAQQFAKHNFQHEDEKLLRAPLVIAAAKLFKWMPQHVGQQNLRSFLFILNNLLMSRSHIVRQGARKLMIQLIKLLGPKQLAFVVRELKQTMTKGYQVHVMMFTVHALVNSLESTMLPGDIDACLRDVMEICKWETFGNDQFENEQQSNSADGGIAQSESHGVPEAKGNQNKTAETLTKIGRFVGSERALKEKVLGQMREIAEASPNSTTVRKLSDWLRALCVGLRFNAGGIPPLRQLQFALQMTRNHLRQMQQDQEYMDQTAERNGTKKSGLRPQSCLLLPPEPKRLGVIQHVNLKSKMHIFVEFSLQILTDQLRARSTNATTRGTAMINDEQEQTDSMENAGDEDAMGEMEAIQTELAKESSDDVKEVLNLLEQFIPLLLDALKQKYDKIIALSLRSILYLLKYPLKSWKSCQSELVNRLFSILADYAAMGQAANQPAIIELQQNLFKCFTQVIRDTPLNALMNDNRMELLMNYVETDILDSHKQATAFNLVKAIIGRKVDDEKISNMIEYLSEIAITSYSANIRSQCRQVILLYLTIHPKGQRTYEDWMEFFLNQTEYELEDGRLSALEMIHSIISAFTEEANDRYALLAYMKLAARLVNDKSERCSQFVALCLHKLLSSITAAAFNDVHAATRDWLIARKPSIRLLAWRAFTEFVHSGSAHFTPSLIEDLIKKTCATFSTEATEFSKEVPASIKLALCNLLKAIAEKRPQGLMEELLATSEEPKKSSKIRRNKKSNKGGQTITEEGKNHVKFIHFFANLEHCLLACRIPTPRSSSSFQANNLTLSSPSDQIRLSIAAGQFLVQLLAHQSTRETLIQKLTTSFHSVHESPNSIDDFPLVDSKSHSLLFTICHRCIVALLLLNPKMNERKTKMERRRRDEKKNDIDIRNDQEEEEDKQQMEMEENDGSVKEEKEEEEKVEEKQNENDEEQPADEQQWDDNLADLAIRLLAVFAPSLNAEQFDLVCRYLSKLCWTEAVKEPDKARKRLCILKLVGLLALRFSSQDCQQFDHLCNRFLPLLYREMNKKSPKFTTELHTLAMDVAEQFRKQLGNREFSNRLAQCQRERAGRKQQRKQQEKAKFVTDPAAAIAAKQKRHHRKRLAKQRRLDEFKPYRALKRRRREEAVRRATSPAEEME